MVAKAVVAPKASTTKACNGTFYQLVRPLAVLSKFLGSFPLAHTLKNDGRKLSFSYIALIHLWDIATCALTFTLFINSCSNLIARSNYDSDDDHISIWLTFTCYFVTIRGLIQFVLLHAYSSRLPKLLAALEEYHQEIGKSIIKHCEIRWYTKFISLLWTFAILIIMEISSFYFFGELCKDSAFLAAWPVAISFLCANLYKELPMNMFVLICKYLTSRFKEIRDEIRNLRERVVEKVTGKELETLRLQHAALTRIVSHVQRCYGMQLAVNLLFLLLDTVLQLFFFFIVTSSRNVILLVLALYYLIMTILLLAIVNQMEDTDEGILEEIAAFELNSAPREQQLQVQLFTAQLTARPVKMSASGFVVVNNALICSLTAAVAAYIVMLVQFMPYIEMQMSNITLPSIN